MSKENDSVQQPYILRFPQKVRLKDTKRKRWNFGDPRLMAAQWRAIKTRRAAIKRRLKIASLPTRFVNQLNEELELLAEMETGLFGVHHREPNRLKRPPSAKLIIANAIIWRCLKKGKPHLVLPKLAAMFPEDPKYKRLLARECKRDERVKRALRRVVTGEIVGSYEDRIERLIAENYFNTLKGIAPDRAVDVLQTRLGVVISEDKYRRHVKSLFLDWYS